MTDKKYNATACNLWLCRGLQLENAANASVISWMPGQKVHIDVKITIKHHVSLTILSDQILLFHRVFVLTRHQGTANVSIVSTKTNKIIGDQLLYWNSYADERLATMPANNTAFDVVIPTTLGNQCATAGDCVLQWWWYGTAAKQTYESCVDFTIMPMKMPMKGRAFEA